MNQNLLLIVVIIILVLVIVFAVSPRSYYSEIGSNPILKELHEDLEALNPAYGVIPLRSCNSAYTLNKSSICICTHDPKTNRRYPLGVLRYVLYHELAHMTSKDYGHGETFQRNFKTILHAAIKKGLYDPNTIIPHDYCGTTD
jgi:hypothetical protein